jgi:hypothetical protein
MLEPSVRILGVTKINNSALFDVFVFDLNRKPTPGISPRKGTLFIVSRRSVS